MTRSNKKQRGCPGSPAYWQAASYQQRMFVSLRNRVLNMALARFKYINLPPTCDARYLEQTLLLEGCATIAHPVGQPGIFYSTRMVMQGVPNIYDNPTKWQSIGNNGWQFSVTAKNGVLMYDNLARVPVLQSINLLCNELCDIIRTMQQNRLHARMPFILVGPQERETDMISLLSQVMDGELAIIATEGIHDINIETLTTGVQWLGKELQEQLINTWAQIYALLGISNIPFKAERMIEDEVNNTTASTDLSLLSPLDARRAALDVFNDRFAEYLPAPVEVVANKDILSANYNFINAAPELAKYGTEVANMIEAEAGGVQ